MMWVLLLALAAATQVSGHGRVLEPPSRASAWRFGFPTEPDYDDDGANCGGFDHQWSVNKGKCGICGDAYDLKEPRPHELGGEFGTGVIVRRYQPGELITLTVVLTTSHLGYWTVSLCPDPENNHQECFDRNVLELENGDTVYYPKKGSVKYELNYRLPPGIICEHCVLQWKYIAGNNWGVCGNGTEALGCGNQEQFFACSDIAIRIPKDQSDDKKPDEYGEIPYPLLYYLKHGYFDSQQGKEEVEQVKQVENNKIGAD